MSNGQSQTQDHIKIGLVDPEFYSGQDRQHRKQFVAVNGEKSKMCPVLSGIPQGSVLGPLLFVIFINDLPDIVASEVFLYADDTKIFNKVKDSSDVKDLQEDLEKLTEWSNEWLLKFHPDKCKHIRIGKRSKTTPEYSLQGRSLETIHEEKDIGVMIDDNLEFEKHICEKVQKANQMFGLIRRTFEHLDATTFIPLYKSLVRTHLDGAVCVVNPRAR